MPSHIVDPDERYYHEDHEAERHHQRYELALGRLTISDVLATVDDMVQSEPDMRKHPLHHLVRHALKFGTYGRSGRRAHLGDVLCAAYEDMIEVAIERLVAEELANFGPWEEV
jgi:hypothetical protein